MSYDNHAAAARQQSFRPARVISFQEAQSGNRVNLTVTLDNLTVGDLRVEFEPSIKALNPTEAHLISAAMGAVAAQTCLASRVCFQFGLVNEALPPLQHILDLLYGAHAYAQLLAEIPAPYLETGDAGAVPLRATHPHPRRTVLLWSGGKDSLAALLTLRRNGFEVYGLHVTANFVSAREELKAAEVLARLYELPLIRVNLEWDLIRQLGRTYSLAFDNYPLHNAVPFGRDLILVVAAAIVARRVNADYVCAGYETDLWQRLVPWQGRLIARHDVQSSVGGQEMNQLLTTSLGVHFFSPIAGFREYRILRHLFTEHPDAWPHIESCFWGGWCGLCSKCARYQLVQRQLDEDILRFRASALEPDSPFLTRLSHNVHNDAIPFWEEQVFSLFELRRRRALEVSDAIDATLRESDAWYTGNRGKLESTLESISPDGLAPDGFEWIL